MSKQIKIIQAFLFLSIAMIMLMTPWQDIMQGFKAIIMESDILISDYFEIGGLAAGSINALLLALFSFMLMQKSEADFDGMTIGTMSMMAGFGLFGKNILNILPIVLGSYLFSLYTKESYGDNVKTGLLASSFSPIITEILFVLDCDPVLAFFLALFVGISVGFLITPIAKHLFKIHKGYSLYNVGFVVGILSTLYVSLMKSFGFISYERYILSSGNNRTLAVILSLFFLLSFLWGYLGNGQSFKGMGKLFKETGYQVDLSQKYGFSIALMNMSINGFLALVYVLFIAKGDLSGPVVGAILVVYGFGALAKHWKNILPVIIGVYLGSLIGFWDAASVSSLFAALFGTALAPIAGVYGPFIGMLVGFMNASLVLNIGFLHGGMNLYNTGFSVGLLAAVFVPILEFFSKRSPYKSKDL